MSLNRRAFLRSLGIGAVVYAHSRLPICADALDIPNFDPHMPADKGFKPEWIEAFFARGTPEIFSQGQLDHIQMPISGIVTGQEFNLSGDGAIAGWRLHATSLENTVQGFTLRTNAGGRSDVHPLNRQGFPGMTFRGEYPIAKLEYANTAVPVAISLEAFSPYCPLNLDDSGIPATIFNFSLKNTSATPVEATIAASWENAVCGFSRNTIDGTRRNQITRGDGLSLLTCSAAPIAPDPANRPDIIFEDWAKDTYDGWTVVGTAFGSGPVAPDKLGDPNRLGGRSTHLVSSSLSAGDSALGKLTSAPFTISRHYINFWLAGGPFPETVYLALLVDGKTVKSQTGIRTRELFAYYFDVRQWEGKQATIQIVDASSDHDGFITIGRIFFSDQSGDGPPMGQFPDYGDMSVALVGKPAEVGIAEGNLGLEGDAGDDASVPLAQTLIGTLGRTVQLAPGESATVMFVLTTWFPNLHIRQLGPDKRYYTTQYKSSQDVAQHVATNLDRLISQTRLWRDTWYDSTLPYWFLDRTFANASTPASGTCYRISSGRFYAYEGAPAPNYEGTCTHVWQYAHSLARTFPSLERLTREWVDLGVALDAPTGVIGFRGEASPNGLAVDGQCGTIMRFYREHQMSPDDSWLKRNWEKIKLTYNPLFAQDADEDGILEGRQNNTLDCAWFGQISWMSSEYCGACRAGEAMAREMGDDAFATKCAKIADAGLRNIPARLFNGEYFFSIPDPKNQGENSGDGSYIDQVFGQGWAFQIGLPRILPEKETRAALTSLWKYNFSPDVLGYFNAHRTEGSAQYVYDGAGMIQCTFPRSDWDYNRAGGYDLKTNPFTGYFIDTWTGQEHQVAGHMIWEGLVQEGLAIERAIHERYNPWKRNPWQEEEAGIHYSRAMASHGVYIGACGYEYHGPKGHLGFAPKLAPENFRAAFTAAEGWGTYAQTSANHQLQATVDLKYGQLKLKTFALMLDGAPATPQVQVKLAGDAVAATAMNSDGRVIVNFSAGITLKAGAKLTISVG